ncbi:hypothetical protein IQ268_09050 [Oculatella sp. LEGE 06141]|nr:hypothetical protein [Oculatella sp. LEGE 06141]
MSRIIKAAIAIAVPLLLAGGSVLSIRHHALEESQDLIDRQGLNGMLSPIGEDAQQTMLSTARDGVFTGLAVGLVGATAIAYGVSLLRTPQPPSTGSTELKDLLSQLNFKVDELRFEVGLFNIANDHQPDKEGQ